MTEPSALARPSRGLFRAFSALVLSQLIAALLGYAYWVAAARSLDPAQIAAAYSSVAVMLLFGNLAQLGYGTLLLTELPGASPGSARRMLRHAIINVGTAGLVLGSIWVAVGPHVSSTYHLALSDPTSDIVLILGVGGTAVGLVLDQAVLGLGRSGVQVIRNVTASSLKFPLLVILIAVGSRTHSTLLLAWVAPLLVATAAVPVILRLPRPGPDDRESWSDHIRRLGRSALLHHALNLSLQASPLLLPLLAAWTLPVSEYASFSIAWLIATFLFIPPFMLAVALLATSVGDLPAFSRLSRHTLPGGMLISLGCYLGAAVLARPVMIMFGSHYSSAGPGILRIIALGGFAFVVKDHFFALYRVQRHLARAAVIAIMGIALELVGAAIGSDADGVHGLSIGWLIGLYVQALYMSPAVLSQYHAGRAPAPAELAEIQPDQS